MAAPETDILARCDYPFALSLSKWANGIVEKVAMPRRKNSRRSRNGQFHWDS